MASQQMIKKLLNLILLVVKKKKKKKFAGAHQALVSKKDEISSSQKRKNKCEKKNVIKEAHTLTAASIYSKYGMDLFSTLAMFFHKILITTKDISKHDSFLTPVHALKC